MLQDYTRYFEHWMGESVESFEIAESVFEKGYYKHTAYMTHLAVEMLLKAHVVKATREMPPKLHNLLRLAELAEISLDDSHAASLRVLNLYQVVGRYRDIDGAPLSRQDVALALSAAKEFREWLAQKS